MPYPPQKKLLKRKKNYNSKDICYNFANFFRTPKRNKELKMQLGQLQCEIS